MDNSVTILGQIILLLLGFFSTFVIFNFMSKFEREVYRKKSFYVIGYILYTFGVFIIKNLDNGVVNLIVTAVFTAFMGHFLYNRKRIFLLYYSIFIIFIAVTQIIASFLFNLICYKFNINFYSLDTALITISVIINIVVLGMSRLFITFYSKKKISRLTLVQFINFLILPIFSMFYITTLMMYVQVYLSPQDIILLIVNIVSILALNIFITNIFESISRNNELKNQLLLHEELSKLQYEYYGAIENKYNSSRKLIHDVKNHIHTIENLYKAQEHEKARAYSENMYRLFEELGQKQFTSNKTLNIILNDKYQKAIRNNITLKCFVETAELDFIKDIDLTTIFANLLDNAIEAAQESVGEKEICLKLAKFNDFLVINISNTTNEELITKGNLLRTTKKNHSGLGLQNVKLALSKYQGNMTINYHEGVFTVNIVIPSD